MIKTIFFDLDNVIYTDDLLYFKYAEILWMFLRKYDWNWTFDKVIQNYIALKEKYDDPNPHLTIARKYLPEKALRDYKSQVEYFNRKNRNKYIRIIPGMSPVIQNLNHAYQIGIIANQQKEDFNFITNFKLSIPYKIAALSSQLKYAKPDSEIFLWALEKTQTQPEEAVMVGDRWDLDIRPAKRLGMRTVRVLFDYRTKGIFPQNDREKLYFKAQQNIPSRSQKPLFQRTLPTPIAKKPEDIINRINELDGGATAPSEPEMAKEKTKIEVGEEKSWKDVLKEILTELSEQP